MQPGTSVIPFLIIVPLVIWRLHSRIRRSIGRQPMSKVRPWITLAIFPTLVVFLGITAFPHRELLWAMHGGLAGGVLLGIYGLGKTQFENTPQGMFYTPNAHVGIALSAVFAARIVYRLFQFQSMDAAQANAEFAKSPLTLAVFGLLAGYYIAYAIGLVRWQMSVKTSP